MRWLLSHRRDPRALPLANRHYNRQTPDSPQFVPPGRCIVLLSENADALWVTSWPRYASHEWVGAWVNTLFRNESSSLSSELIVEAVAATRAFFGDPPAIGMVTFVDPGAIRSTNPGCCYRKVGFRRVGVTKERERIAFQLLPSAMPAPSPARPRWSAQFQLFEVAS